VRLFGWFDTSASDAFAREIAAEFVRALPPDWRGPPREAERRYSQALEVMANRAQKYQAAHGLGWYRKSKFLNTIKESMIGLGHPAALVDRVVYAVALRTGRHPA
jgi:hypothetical protein